MDRPTHEETKSLCDTIVTQAAMAMQENGASVELILDRLLTYSAAQAYFDTGPEYTAALFRSIADNIEGGAFSHLDKKREAKRH
ncbi:hypothetical protein [uncultured Jannaschia sp.]|uniref:hypothetical protein n=1 Tax=uncultured Jannaschia sp. TaxID=293347 RepID=UPI002631709D|nr:hypothetical protein [uncultured Jannaschia sp.]